MHGKKTLMKTIGMIFLLTVFLFRNAALAENLPPDLTAGTLLTEAAELPGAETGSQSPDGEGEHRQRIVESIPRVDRHIPADHNRSGR